MSVRVLRQPDQAEAPRLAPVQSPQCWRVKGRRRKILSDLEFGMGGERAPHAPPALFEGRLEIAADRDPGIPYRDAHRSQALPEGNHGLAAANVQRELGPAQGEWSGKAFLADPEGV